MAGSVVSKDAQPPTAASLRRAWRQDRARFERIDVDALTPELAERIATAAWWLDDDPVVFACRERAYRRYLELDDRYGAARMATWLALDHWLFRGSMLAAHGLLRRARRHLEGMPPSPDGGWLTHWEAHLALFGRGSVRQAGDLAAEAQEIGRGFGVVDLETISLALGGLVKVAVGEVEVGMRQLDEAAVAALSGEVEDPDVAITTCCYLIAACERVRDWPRALEWCANAEEMARRWAYRSMFAYCRGHYAAVLLWRGEWTRAEAELQSATHELMVTRPGWVLEPIVRLGELRLRQGRPDRAAALFAQAPGMPHALLGRAELALDAGEVADATGLVQRYLRRVPVEDLTMRADGLEVAVRAWLAAGEPQRARNAADELAATAAIVNTAPLRAAARFATGLVVAAGGDRHAAIAGLEDAADLFAAAGSPYGQAQARAELARTYLLAGHHEPARREAQAAYDRLRALGAGRDLRRLAPLIVALGLPATAETAPGNETEALTVREAEVLRHIARGEANREIADRLFISVRTVERHVSSIYAKIGAEGSAARAVATVYAFERGMVRVLDT